MKKILAIAVWFVAIQVEAQNYLDYQLRLEPVWARVADALENRDQWKAWNSPRMVNIL
jgi:hypothetical protein